jgi:oligopeptide transport system substrate-binding protein
MFRYLKIALVLFMITHTVASCQKKEEETVKLLRLNFEEGDMPSLHPFSLISHLRGRSLGKLLFEGLTRIDENNEAVMAGAERVEITDDQKRYLFYLRENYWSDGEPVTAEHFANSWRHALTPNTDCPRADLFYLIKNGRKVKKGELSIENVGIQVLDDNTLAVDLESPSPNFLKLLAHSLFAPLKHPFEEPKTFNGPFVVKAWEKNAKLQLAPNTRFWNKKNVKLMGIDISCVQDSNTAFYLFEQNQIDWIGDPFGPLTMEIANALKAQEKCFMRPVDRFLWVYLNTTHPVLQSQKIRQALSASIDRAEISSHLFPSSKPIETAVSGMTPPAQRQKPKERWDPKDLFKQGLEELDIKVEECLPLRLSYPNLAGRKQFSEYLKETWEKAFGLKIQLQASEWNVFRAQLEKNDFDMAGSFESALYNDPLELIERFEEKANWNFSLWENQLFKKKIAQIREESNKDVRNDLLIEAEDILVTEVPFIPIFRNIHIYYHPKDLKNYKIDSAGCIDFSYATFE